MKLMQVWTIAPSLTTLFLPMTVYMPKNAAASTEKNMPLMLFPACTSHGLIMAIIPASPRKNAIPLFLFIDSPAKKCASIMVNKGFTEKITAAVDALEPSTPS